MSSHCACSRLTSRASSSSLAPSAAVRTITPAPSGTSFFSTSRSRLRSVSGSLRLMPEALPFGHVDQVPAGAARSWLVSRAPLCPIGSLVTWTSTESPDLSACSIERARPSRPVASQLTSPA